MSQSYQLIFLIWFSWIPLDLALPLGEVCCRKNLLSASFWNTLAAGPLGREDYQPPAISTLRVTALKENQRRTDKDSFPHYFVDSQFMASSRSDFLEDL